MALVIVLIPTISNGQYVSGKFIPDRTKDLGKDMSDWSYKLSTTINTADLKKHIFTLASDEFQGRETGAPGNDKAAEYISNVFAKLHLPEVGPDGAYSQKVAFSFISWAALKLSMNGNSYRNLRDFIAFPQFSKDQKIKKGEVVFIGYGIDDEAYSDYNGVNVKDKIVVAYDREPINIEGNSLISNDVQYSEWSDDWHLKSKAAQKHGAKALMIVSNDIKGLINKNRRSLVNKITLLGKHSAPEDEANTLFISPELAKSILGDKVESIIAMRDKLRTSQKTMEAVILDTKINLDQKVENEVLLGQNLLGFIEGSDLKDELVIVSAHYDHVGIKGAEVYNGADDNASGTSTVLEIAEALQLGKLMKNGPRRSVLCLMMTGEEKGLLGSEYYVENPVYPIENTIADVNIDMVGRWGEEYQGTTEPYNYVIGSDRLSMDLHNINEAMNQKYSQMLMDYKYNDEADPNRFYFRSDHYNFAKKGIPAIFFFNGVHEDYHRLTDTPDKIDLSLMETRGRQIFHTVWELANRDQRIQLNSTLNGQ